MNHRNEPIALRMRLEAAADFADLFEVRNPQTKQGEYYRRVEDGRLVLGYRRQGFVRETWISASAPEATVDEQGLTFSLQVEPQSEWTTGVDVVTARDGTQQTHTAPKYSGVMLKPGRTWSSA
jgi:hypothetical protein